MITIDSETHVIYRAWPIETNPGRSMVERFTWHEHSGDLLAAEMDRAGVDKTILISYDGYDVEWFLRSIGSTPEDFITGRKYTLAAVHAHPDRFIWFSTLKDPRRDENVQAVHTDFDDGAHGLKIFPSFLVLPVDHPALVRIFELCIERDTRVILSFEDAHPPETCSIPEFFDQLDAVMAKLPDLRVQLNHAGAVDPLTREIDTVCRVVNRHENIYVSTAMMGLVWDDGTEYPFPNYLRRLERLKEGVGIERMMWGTDWPHLSHQMHYPQAIDCVRRHASFMSDSDKDAFLGGNARRFLGSAVGSLAEDHPRRG
jgi:predicted TIM-barrel fold metal-dependent hydrolase